MQKSNKNWREHWRGSKGRPTAGVLSGASDMYNEVEAGSEVEVLRIGLTASKVDVDVFGSGRNGTGIGDILGIAFTASNAGILGTGIEIGGVRNEVEVDTGDTDEDW